MKSLGLLLGMSVLAALPGNAATFNFSGTFNSDTDVAFFTFTLLADTPGTQLFTTSYAGTGGFEPYLSLYLGDGTQMNPAQPGPCQPPLVVDIPTGICGDVYYPTTLSFPGGVWGAGTYIVALTLYGNGGIGNLGDGFFVTDVLGQPAGTNFSCTESYQGIPDPFSPTDPFCSLSIPGVQRNGTWALQIDGVDSAQQLTATPEPGTWAITLVGLASLAARRFRKS